MAQIGVNVGDKILEAMGIDPTGVKGFELRCYADEVIMLKIERFATEEATTGFLSWLRKTFSPKPMTTIVELPLPDAPIEARI